MDLARRAVVVALAAAALFATVPAVAAADRPQITFGSPSPAEGATLSTGSVEFGFTYNRKPKATASIVCALSGPTSSSGGCDAPVASGSKDSRSGTSYSGLHNGDYTLTVTLTLTDGGRTSATRRFTVNVTPGGHIYWANYGMGTIGRANLDGTDVNQSFISGATGAFAVAADAGHIYWTNIDSRAIGRANLDGTDVNPSFISTNFLSLFRGVAADAGHIYWTVQLPRTIMRANLDGTDANENFISTASAPFGVAVDADHIYWANDFAGTIGRANLDGTDVNPSFISTASAPFGVAVDADHVYWTNYDASTIGRANLDGTDVNPSFISTASPSFGVAVDADHVYWANDFAGTIGRANLDGTDVNQSFIAGTPMSPIGVAVDAG